MLLEVLIGNPKGIVEQRLKMLFKERLVELYTSYLRKLQSKDCYNAAMADGDHTLYLMKPPWIPSNFVPANAFPSGLVCSKQFVWEKGPNGKRIPASPQAQKMASLEHTMFSFAPTDKYSITLLSEQELVESKEVAHRDKIGRGPDQPDEDGPRQNRVRMSFRDNDVVETRKVPGGMRFTRNLI